MTEEMLLKQEELERKQELAQALEELYEKKKLQRAASSFKDFCEYVIKDESSGTKIALSELQLSWLRHIDFCEKHGLHALILAPMSCLTAGHKVLMFDGSTRAVEDVVVGDELLGPDKNKRTVISTTSGNQPTVEIIRNGSTAFICSVHELIVVYDVELNATYPIEIRDIVIDPRGISNFRLISKVDTAYTHAFCHEFYISMPAHTNVQRVYGFELDGDKQYLLEDGTIMHNSGKCVAANTQFITKARGAIAASSLVEGDEVLSNDETNTICWRKVAAVEVQPKKPTVLVSTEKGRQLRCTSDHKLLTRLGWVEARALGPGNYVYTPGDWHASLSNSIQIDTDIMYTLGAMYGTQTINGERYINTTTIQSACKNSVVEFYPDKYYSSKVVSLHTTQGHSIEEFIMDAGLPTTDVYAALTLLDARSIRAFLAGLLDSTGELLASRKSLSVTVASRRQAASLQMACEAIGIDCVVRVRHLHGSSIYKVVFNKKHNKQFQEVPSEFLLERLCVRAPTTTVENLNLDRVLSVEYVGNEETVGVEVEGTHTHITNGLITHNTQIISIALPLFLIGKNPGIRMALVNISDDNAIQRLGAIASYVLEDEDYHKVFPHVKQKKGAEWTKHKITVERNTKSKDPTIAASGVLSGGIGARLDKLLVDDIFDYRTGVSQPATRKQICDTYKLVWLSRLEPTETATIICTRWHERDLAGEILNDPLVRDRYGILIQAVKEDFSGLECKVIVPDHLKDSYKELTEGFVEV